MDKELEYQQTTDIVSDVSHIIENAQKAAYKAVNQVLVVRNWLLGKRIAEEELKGSNEENYGLKIIINLSKELTAKYGKGFDRSSLYRYVQFYQTFPEIVATVRRQSPNEKNLPIVQTTNAQFISLSWSHYRITSNFSPQNINFTFQPKNN